MFLLFILVFSSVYYVVSSLFLFLCFGFFFSFRGWVFFLFLNCCLVFMMGCSFGVRVGVDIVCSFSRCCDLPCFGFFVIVFFVGFVLFCFGFVLGLFFCGCGRGFVCFFFGFFVGFFCVFSPYYFSLTN